MVDLARPTSDVRYPFESIGKKIGADGLRQDKSKNLKGTLHYEAEFIPALHIKGLKFDGLRNPIQQAADDEDGGEVVGDNENPSEEENQQIPETITTRHVKGAKSTDTMMTVASTKTTDSAKTTASISANGNGAQGSPVQGSPKKLNGHLVDDGIELSKEELLQSCELFVPLFYHPWNSDYNSIRHRCV